MILHVFFIMDMAHWARHIKRVLMGIGLGWHGVQEKLWGEGRTCIEYRDSTRDWQAIRLYSPLLLGFSLLVFDLGFARLCIYPKRQQTTRLTVAIRRREDYGRLLGLQTHTREMLKCILTPIAEFTLICFQSFA